MTIGQTIYQNDNELTIITNDYFKADNGKAADIFFNDSFGMNWFLKQRKGLFEMVPGGSQFQLPLENDWVAAGPYPRGTTALSRGYGTTSNKSYAQQIMQNATFPSVYYHASTKMLRIDLLRNRGVYAMVKEVTTRIANAQKSIARALATDFHGTDTAGADNLNGTLACCFNGNPANQGNYGDIANTGANWTGLRDATSEPIGLDTIRTMASDAKIRDGKGGKPDLVLLTENLFNVIADILQTQERFVESTDAVDAGFTGIMFEGKKIVADDYLPANTGVWLNTDYYGFHVYEGGLFERTPWILETATPSDKYMDIYFDGNVVCNGRDTHKAHTNFSNG